MFILSFIWIIISPLEIFKYIITARDYETVACVACAEVFDEKVREV